VQYTTYMQYRTTNGLHITYEMIVNWAIGQPNQIACYADTFSSLQFQNESHCSLNTTYVNNIITFRFLSAGPWDSKWASIAGSRRPNSLGECHRFTNTDTTVRFA